MKNTILTREELGRLGDVIASEELKSCGEIRVSIHERRKWSEKRKDVRSLAIREFHRLKMNRTEERNGVLLYLIVADREFQILGDEGIHAFVGDETWTRIAAALGVVFRNGEFFDGLSQAVRAIGEVLARHYPPKSGDRNELPNDIVTR